MAVSTQKLLPSSKGSSGISVKRTKIGSSSFKSPTKSSAIVKYNGADSQSEDKFRTVRVKIDTITKLLEGSAMADQKERIENKKEEEKKKRSKKESDLEKKKDDKKKKKDDKVGLPKIGFFDKLKNFFKNILIGWLLNKLIGNDKLMGGLQGILSGMVKGIEFTADLILGILDFAGTALIKGQEALDWTNNFIKDKLGEDASKNFEGFISNLDKMFNAISIVGLAALAFGNEWSKGSKPDKPKKPTDGPDKPRKPVDGPDKPRKPTDVPDKPKKPLSQFELEQQRKKLTEVILDDSSAPTPKAPKKRGGVFGFFGDVKDRVGSFVSEKWKSFSNKVSNIGKSLRSKYNKVTSSVGNAISGMAKNARDAIFNQIIERARPLLDPLTKKAKQVGKVLIENLSKIPGLKNVLNKAGVKSLSNPAEILSKVGKKLGPKVIPVVGGLVNLLFAYDRFSQGDVVGGMIETVSGGLDLAGAFTAGGGSLASTVLDAYMFARDMFPETIVGAEDTIVNKLGLSGLQESASNITKKLPPLSTIVDKFMSGGTEAATTAPADASEPSTSDSSTASTSSTSDKKYSVSSSSSGIVSIGKELARKGFAVAEHPDFTKDTSGGRYTPGKGYVSDVHKGQGHYDGRAIDVTQHAGGDPEYKKTYISVLNSLQDNPAIKMLIHDTWGFYKDGKKSGPGSHGHPTHMHIEVKDKGGYVKPGLFINLAGRPGKKDDVEYVIPGSQTDLIDKEKPGLLELLRTAKNKKDLNSIIESYAEYENGGQEVIIVNKTKTVTKTEPSKSSSSIIPIPFGGGGSHSDILSAIG